MLMKRRQLLKSNFQEWKCSISDSWEERAFAEDACSNLGGCIWPPRSYSCSFCRREFSSAQALGGHMNVHRKERARLKQSLSPQNDFLQYQNNNQNHSHANFPTEVCILNFDLHHPNSIGSSTIVASTHSSSRVSAQENLSGQSGSDSLAVVENPREETCLNDDDFVETDLFMGFNSAETPNSPTGSHGDISCKRPKTISFSLMKPCSSDRYSFRSEITGANSNSMQDIDLELRLGEPPKVK